jgi:hypothetical protein
MRRLTILTAALAGLAMAGWGNSAAAHGDVYVGPPVGFDTYTGYPNYREPDYTLPVYSYRRHFHERYHIDPDYHRDYGGCGVYRFWNGYRCIDARRYH